MLGLPAPVLAAGPFVPDSSPPFGASPTPYVVLIVIGFVIGVAGHIVRAKTLVALGIGLVFLGTFLLPLLTNVIKSSGG
jgi:hypothetical protein